VGKRERHLRQLADDLGADLRLRPHGYLSGCSGSGALWGSYKGEVDLGGHWAIVRGWDASERAYLVALHELGHLAYDHHGTTTDDFIARYHSRELEAEAEAWEWALDRVEHSRLGRGVLTTIWRDWLGSYVRHDGLATAGPTFARVEAHLNSALAA
jgi:hypothetical protein